MSQYILVENNGLIQIDDLRLIGSSSKRDNSSKIGMFGSGWKYALAWLIRNDAIPLIYSGTEEIRIDYVHRFHRNNAVRVITINEEETSLTAEMGPQWEGWMAFREIFSNAVDEGGHSVTFNVTDISKVEGKSRIYIPMTDKMKDVMENFDKYFSFKKKTAWENEDIRIFINEKEAPTTYYRKGIRCYDNSSSYSKRKGRLDFDMMHVTIDENRLAQYYHIDREIKKHMVKCDSVSVWRLFLLDKHKDMMPETVNDAGIEAVQLLKKEGYLFTTETLAKLSPNPKDIALPVGMFSFLMGKSIVDNPIEGIIKRIDDYDFYPDKEYNNKAIEWYLKKLIPDVEVFVGRAGFNGNVRYTVEGDKYTFFVNKKDIKRTEEVDHELAYCPQTGNDRYTQDMRVDSAHIAGWCLAVLPERVKAELFKQLFDQLY